MLDPADAVRKARRLQTLIAGVFIGLGGWCLLNPASVIELTVLPEFATKSPIALVAVGAFGAQAMLAGLFSLFSIFTRLTFAVYGVALLPFFVFDWWFYAVQPLFNELILFDVVGNLIMLGVCVWGWWLLRPADVTPRARGN